MAALGWLLNLGFGGSGTAAVAVETGIEFRLSRFQPPEFSTVDDQTQWRIETSRSHWAPPDDD